VQYTQVLARSMRSPRASHGVASDASVGLLILSLYNIIICLVAAVLYVAVNNLEPNRRYASTLKILIISLAVVAIFAHLRR
jgi:hypothetical protein